LGVVQWSFYFETARRIVAAPLLFCCIPMQTEIDIAKMSYGVAVVSILALVFSIPNFGWAQNSAPKQSLSANSNSANLVARGQYIVDGLSRCGQCHTPRDSNGNPIRDQWLEGAAVWLQPAEPSANWPLKAPRIAGTPAGSDADLLKLLTTGIWRDGNPLREPMPQFRMSPEDAKAVIAYLRSLSPQPH
jgi:mono/diheme cytochrome c family protein